MPPPDPSDYQVILYRLGQLEALPKTVYEIRDEVRDLASDMRSRSHSTCPAPGKCLELEKDIDRHTERLGAIERSMTLARGIVLGLSILGLANLTGLLLQFLKV